MYKVYTKYTSKKEMAYQLGVSYKTFIRIIKIYHSSMLELNYDPKQRGFTPKQASFLAEKLGIPDLSKTDLLGLEKK